jgi:hypothetical protein
MTSRLLRITLLALTTLVFYACRKDNNSQVPLVAVDITINLNDPQFIDLAVPTGWIYLTGGSMGLIVYRNNDSEFSCYDRHSPYNVEEYCRVSVSDDNITIVDECSDSQWVLIDGQVINGPAEAPLRSYSTNYNPPFLRIYN